VEQNTTSQVQLAHARRSDGLGTVGQYGTVNTDAITRTAHHATAHQRPTAAQLPHGEREPQSAIGDLGKSPTSSSQAHGGARHECADMPPRSPRTTCSAPRSRTS
jgi:hypothetical protein